MAMQLCCRACPNIAEIPPLPQPCKELLHPCTIEAMDIVILLLVFTQSFPTNIRYNSVQAALIWLHHSCLLGAPVVGRNRYGYITPAFSGAP